jgi:hypothetical protein
MLELPRDDARRLLTRAQCQPIHRATHCSGNDAHVSAAIFGIFGCTGTSCSDERLYRGAAHADKMQPSIRHPPSPSRRDFQMTLTVAHISPIMSVIAGLLILIMPRLLNLVVAIFLILNGLIGLGLLKWLHI